MSAHLTDGELRDFAAGRLAAESLLRADDHLSTCTECRGRASALKSAAGKIDALRVELSGPGWHLSDEEVQLVVLRRMSAPLESRVSGHLAECAICREQVEDLRSWAMPAPRARFPWWAIAAGVLIGVLVPATAWYVRAGRHAASSDIAGVAALSSQEQAQVQAALTAGMPAVPDFVADIRGSREVLMGSPTSGQNTFRLLTPVGTGVVSDQPGFEWQALPGAATYVVSVFDEQANLIARSPQVAETIWRFTGTLPRDRTYVWQVAADRGGATIITPLAPAPPAKFHVIDERSANRLQRLQEQQPASHLLLGVLNMNAGVLDAAAKHFELVSATDPHADLARRSLGELIDRRPR